MQKYTITVKSFSQAPCPVGDHFFKEWEAAILEGEMPKEFTVLRGEEVISYVKVRSMRDEAIEVRKDGVLVFSLSQSEALQVQDLVNFFIKELDVITR